MSTAAPRNQTPCACLPSVDKHLYNFSFMDLLKSQGKKGFRGHGRVLVCACVVGVLSLLLGCHRKTAPPPVTQKPPVAKPKPVGPVDSEEFGQLQGVLEVAAVYRSKGMLAQAQAEIEKTLPGVLHPVNRTRALFELSQIYISQGKLAEAARLFEENPAKEPQADAFRKLYLANIRKMQRREKEAQQIYRGLLKHPFCQRELSLLSNVTTELSNLLAAQGRTAEAIQIYRKTLEAIPVGAGRSVESQKAAAQARLQMAGFHLQKGTPQGAIGLLKEVLSQSASDPALQSEHASAVELYTEALKQAGRYEEAAAHLRLRLSATPATHLFAQLLEVSDRLLDAGKNAQAREQYAYLLAKAPSDLRDRARTSMGVAQLREGNEKAGVDTLVSLIKHTKDPHVRADVRFLLARHFEQGNNPEQARAFYHLLLDDPRHKAFATLALERLKQQEGQ